MVFKKMRKIRRYASRAYGRARRSVTKSTGLSPINVLLAGAVYGAARPFAAKILPDMFSFGPVDSDNVIIGAAGFYAMKKGTGFMRALGAIALASEASIIAARLSSPIAQNTATNSSAVYNYV